MNRTEIIEFKNGSILLTETELFRGLSNFLALALASEMFKIKRKFPLPHPLSKGSRL